MPHVDPQVQAVWDERYAEQERMWSGNPNGALVAETDGLTPGRALDVGCGEGADATWLAGQGWQVTALDVSAVALDRARQHAGDAGIAWVHSGLVDADLPRGSFDLVSAFYPVLDRSDAQTAEHLLLDLVAPGGVLLFVHHADMDSHDHHDSPFDPKGFVWPSMVTPLLGDGWEVLVDERRPRVVPEGGAGAHHVDDLVLKARRS
jgi:SAM-dependent methyltransferase